MVYWERKSTSVHELIEQLKNYPPDSNVMIAFDSGIRMDVEVVGQTHWNDGGDQPREHIVVLTSRDEWDHRENWS